MHKGLYWSQLFLGIGIGLIVASLVWIYTSGDIVNPKIKPEREIVYYNTSDLSISAPELNFSQGEQESSTEEIAPVADDVRSETVVVVPKLIDFVIKPGDTSENIATRLASLNITDGNAILNLLYEKGLDRKLKAGRYQLQEGSKPEEIIAQFIK